MDYNQILNMFWIQIPKQASSMIEGSGIINNLSIFFVTFEFFSDNFPCSGDNMTNRVPFNAKFDWRSSWTIRLLRIRYLKKNPFSTRVSCCNSLIPIWYKRI